MNGGASDVLTSGDEKLFEKPSPPAGRTAAAAAATRVCVGCDARATRCAAGGRGGNGDAARGSFVSLFKKEAPGSSPPEPEPPPESTTLSNDPSTTFTMNVLRTQNAAPVTRLRSPTITATPRPKGNAPSANAGAFESDALAPERSVSAGAPPGPGFTFRFVFKGLGFVVESCASPSEGKKTSSETDGAAPGETSFGRADHDVSRPATSATTTTTSPFFATSAIAVHGGGVFERTKVLFLSFSAFSFSFSFSFSFREPLVVVWADGSSGETVAPRPPSSNDERLFPERDGFAALAIPSGSAASSVDAYVPPFFRVTTARGNDADPTHVCVFRS